MNQISIHSSFSSDTSLFDSIPASIYWKDLNGIYLGRNSHSIRDFQRAGIENNSNNKTILGKDDYDIFFPEVAKQYREHDQEALEKNCKIIRIQFVEWPNGIKLAQLSAKAPLYDNKGKLIGIIGNTIDINHVSNGLDSLNALNSITQNINTSQGTVTLTRREALCLKYYLLGYSAKEIGNKLDISVKTAETHLANIRTKLQCKYRSKIFETVIQYNPLWRNHIWSSFDANISHPSIDTVNDV